MTKNQSKTQQGGGDLRAVIVEFIAHLQGLSSDEQALVLLAMKDSMQRCLQEVYRRRDERNLLAWFEMTES